MVDRLQLWCVSKLGKGVSKNCPHVTVTSSHEYLWRHEFFGNPHSFEHIWQTQRHFFIFFFCIHWDNSFQQPFEAKMKWRHHDVIKSRDYVTHTRQWSILVKLGGQIDVEQEIVNPKFDVNWALFWFIMISWIIKTCPISKIP